MQQRRQSFKPTQISDFGELCFVAMLVTTYGLQLARLVSLAEMHSEPTWSKCVGRDLQKSSWWKTMKLAMSQHTGFATRLSSSAVLHITADLTSMRWL
jgi:hypothetical protein